jgi:hypothetical protein
MTSERPIEPTEILPRSTAGTGRHRRPDDRRQPVQLSPVGPLPALTSAAAAGVVVAGGVAVAAAFSGIRAAAGIGRLLTGVGRDRALAPAALAPAALRSSVVFRYSATTIVAAGGRMDSVHLEMRWGPHVG